MIRTGRRGAPALAAVLVIAAAVVSAQGHVLLHRCVEAGGAWTDTALSLSLLRDTTACPDGTYGLGGVSDGVVVLMSVALPVLVAWALATALGISLGAVVVRAARAVVGLVGRWVSVPRTRPALPVAGRLPAPVAAPAPPGPSLGLLVARPHRAPPLPA